MQESLMKDSLFLMASPSFIGGMASVLDIGDTLTEFNTSPDGDQADHAASCADWDLIASDFKKAASQMKLQLLSH